MIWIGNKKLYHFLTGTMTFILHEKNFSDFFSYNLWLSIYIIFNINYKKKLFAHAIIK